MDIKKIGIGLGAFAVGAVAWTVGTAKFGPKPGSTRGLRAPRQPRPTTPIDYSGQAAAGTGPDAGAGAVVGDSITAPIAPKPADMAAAPVGMAETEKHFHEGRANPAAEHVPSDLIGGRHPGAGDRAPEAFRPDPTAVPTDAEKEALRPATGPAPTLVADRGSGFSEAAGAA
jgi:hypothetical protein